MCVGLATFRSYAGMNTDFLSSIVHSLQVVEGTQPKFTSYHRSEAPPSEKARIASLTLPEVAEAKSVLALSFKGL